ncbi:MAG: multiprotein bridging factor aMBF1 [Candidatus Nanohaloarchaeota archaeon QJJ-5]|nr:multiprotein bridging factor aMBF1 [Candidatus Nanohaloarchaeota archaeon QJJ-5]
MNCEMCGAEGDLKRTKVEGATLKLCEDCQAAGEVLETEDSSSSGRSSRSRSRSRNRSKPRQQQKRLVQGYSEKVKEAREDEDLSMGELADNLNEKRSVVQRIESGDLKPDERLAQKIKNQLEIDLYTSVSSEAYQGQADDPSDDKATIGDVADVKRKDQSDP